MEVLMTLGFGCLALTPTGSPLWYKRGRGRSLAPWVPCNQPPPSLALVLDIPEPSAALAAYSACRRP
jgi:hypothetical protein